MEGLPGGCNPADVLFKLAHGRGIKPPVFDQVTEQGPPHAKTFTWSCSFFEGVYNSVGHGRSKKEARNAAAKNLITQLDLSTLPQKPQRHDNKRKMGQHHHMSAEGDQENGENGSNPKKRRGNKAFGGFPGAGFGGFMDTGMGPGPMFGGNFYGNYGRGRMYQPRRTFEDRHVLDKHRMVYPEETELNHILQSVDKVERALKKISDKFCEDGEGSEREITGVARVGDLAKSLLLKGDKDVELVVMCQNKPTLTLLNTIVQSLTVELESPEYKEEPEKSEDDQEMKEEGTEEKKEEEAKPVEEEIKFDVVDNSAESGFYVKNKYCNIKITMTSTQLRANPELDCLGANGNGEDNGNENGNYDGSKDGNEETTEAEEEGAPGDVKKEEEVKEENGSAEVEKPKEVKEDPADVLSEEFGLKGLAQLRRAKWFAAMAAPLPSCIEAIRVMKEKARRDSAWANIGDWAMESLVERALFSAGYSLTPSKSIMRVLEVIASGLIMPEGPGIKDPCEREDLDVFDHLTLQEKENITKQCQEDIRKIHYRKIHEVLGMDRILTRLEREKSMKAKEAPKEDAKETSEVKEEKEAEQSAPQE